MPGFPANCGLPALFHCTPAFLLRSGKPGTATKPPPHWAGFIENYPGLLEITAESIRLLEEMIVVHATHSSDVEIAVELDTPGIEVQVTVTRQVDFDKAASNDEAGEPV